MGTPCALLRSKSLPPSVGKRLFQSAIVRLSSNPVNNASPAIYKKHALFRHWASFSLLITHTRNSPKPFLNSLPAPLSPSHPRWITVNQTSNLSSGKLSKDITESSDTEMEEVILKHFELHENFVSEAEENCLLEEVEDYLENLDYEYDHWDNAIHGYRETEKSRWSEKSQAILQRIRQTAFPGGEQQLSLVHVLDLAKDGYIKPHVDSVKFCGSTITGLSLLSPAIMRLVKQDKAEHWVNVVLKPRSLYVMKGDVRYKFTHEILKDSDSSFRGQKMPRDRRISIMCRNEPS